MSMEPTESRSMGRSYETERIAIERENGTHIHIYKNVLEKHLPFGIKISDEQIQKFYKKKIEEYPAVREELISANVRYFTDEDKRKTRISFLRGERLCQIGLDENRPPMPLEGGVYIFVLKDGNLYMAKKKETDRGKVQHSSFLSGQSVDAAGTVIVDKKGYIIGVNNHSGHYTPRDKEVAKFLQHLKKNLSITAFSNISVSTKAFSRSQLIMNIFSRFTFFLEFLFSSSTNWLREHSVRKIN